MQSLKSGSQCARILGHLALGRKVTPLSALMLFGCLRLGGRIYELRRRGHKIKSRMIEHNGKLIAEYELPRQRT